VSHPSPLSLFSLLVLHVTFTKTNRTTNKLCILNYYVSHSIHCSKLALSISSYRVVEERIKVRELTPIGLILKVMPLSSSYFWIWYPVFPQIMLSRVLRRCFLRECSRKTFKKCSNVVYSGQFV